MSAQAKPTAVELGEILNRGGWANGDVYRISLGGRRGVLKTYRSKPLPIRWLGRYLLARERRAYAMLRGVDGVPQLFDYDDPYALAMHDVRGRKVNNQLLAERGELIVPSLTCLIDRMHRCGVYHMDLRNHGNILIDAQYRAYAIDFASAVRLRGRNPLSRLAARLCRYVDLLALAKWAGRARAGPER